MALLSAAGLDNADSTLFLGGRGKNAKDISDNLGRETIDSFNTSENRGTQVSHGLTYQKLGKDMTYLFVKSSVALNFTRTGTRSTGF